VRYVPTYARNTATFQQVVDHLRECDPDFVPRLSDRVDIVEYARKIHRFSERFEAWSDGALVGLVAAYAGTRFNGTCFITDVSVIPKFKHNGIASRLLGECVKYADSAGFAEVRLEVAIGNQAAVRLYEKSGFSVESQDVTSMIMSKKPR
jgi:ribosomal protein S18 acetylase RimI-like enzyme